jgi:hypothetical protein
MAAAGVVTINIDEDDNGGDDEDDSGGSADAKATTSWQWWLQHSDGGSGNTATTAAAVKAAKDTGQLTQCTARLQDPNSGSGDLQYPSYYHYTITYLGLQGYKQYVNHTC